MMEHRLIFYAVILIIPFITYLFLRNTRSIMRIVARQLPKVSATEAAVLEAGTSDGWEYQLFQGSPDWDELTKHKLPKLRDNELEFIYGPLQELCRMLNDFQINKEQDLPPKVWEFMRNNKFFALVTPQQFGGLGFSEYAHSEIITQIATCSVCATVTVMVPNSLGPGELLYKYGTKAQQERWLPRLAAGIDVPCFALTSPVAGSDAGSIPDFGIAVKRKVGNNIILGFELTFSKRYITLAPIASLIGLAFKAYDPDGLLGDKYYLGITCALLDRKTKGLSIGMRHNPAETGFMNGPLEGDKVFIPITGVIGELEGVGRGWNMLMECLAVGRGVSLPAMAAGGAKMLAMTTSAYARIRSQFRRPVGDTEAIAEQLGAIAVETYVIDSLRIFFASALGMGYKPAVAAAMTKYRNTEGLRSVVMRSMDILAGKAICTGPSNYLFNIYKALPVAITVEGANILSRSLIIFAQGLVRGHPYLKAELSAIEQDSPVDFNRAFWGHSWHVIKLFVRQFGYNLGLWRLLLFVAYPFSWDISRFIIRKVLHRLGMKKWVKIPTCPPYQALVYRRVQHLSNAFALLVEFLLIFYGGRIKKYQVISGYMADIWINMYVITASMRYFEQRRRPASERAVVEYIWQENLEQAWSTVDKLIDSVNCWWQRIILRLLLMPLGVRWVTKGYRPQAVKLVAIGHFMQHNNKLRNNFSDGVFIGDPEVNPIAQLEYAFELELKVAKIREKIKGIKTELPPELGNKQRYQQLVKDKHLTKKEVEMLRAADVEIAKAIAVDYFDSELEEVQGGS